MSKDFEVKKSVDEDGTERVTIVHGKTSKKEEEKEIKKEDK
jgi:hypothetical protein